MRTIRIALAALALLACLAGNALADPSYPTRWRWIVGDQAAPNNIWNGETGAMEADNSADYQAWVALLPPDAGTLSQGLATAITGSANNGSGLCRIAVVNSGFITSS